MEKEYGIQIQLYSADFKREVQKLIDDHDVKAIIMGNRNTDPWSNELKPFDASTPGWPTFMRVFPILEWNYTDVWTFLRQLKLSYCSLYDAGFTSLGEKHNSAPNPNLKRVSETGEVSFLPAYELTDGGLERESRV
jgi:FAD synthetase